MSSNPKPNKIVLGLYGQRSMARTHTDRPETADLLEMKGWMPGILFEKLECPV